MSSDEEQWLQELPPLKIACTDSDCSHGLHCYRLTAKMRKERKVGICRVCGEAPVQWDRVRKLDIEDVEHTVRSLKTELVRYHFWTGEIDQRARNYARRKGLAGLRDSVRHTLEKKIGTFNPRWDGQQTPRTGNIIYYAQYATATCCRRCLETWYGIPRTPDLTDGQLDYFTELVMLYIRTRMPDLTEGGEVVPSIRRRTRQ